MQAACLPTAIRETQHTLNQESLVTTSNIEEIHQQLSGKDAGAQIDALERLANLLTLQPDLAKSDCVSGLAVRLSQLAGSPNDDVRGWAADVLETNLDASDEDVAALSELLITRQDGETCYWAATLLGRLGQRAADAVIALRYCLTDVDYLPAKERAAWAIGRIGKQAADAMADLRMVAQTSPPRLARLARQAMESIRSVAA